MGCGRQRRYSGPGFGFKSTSSPPGVLNIPASSGSISSRLSLFLSSIGNDFRLSPKRAKSLRDRHKVTFLSHGKFFGSDSDRFPISKKFRVKAAPEALRIFNSSLIKLEVKTGHAASAAAPRASAAARVKLVENKRDLWVRISLPRVVDMGHLSLCEYTNLHRGGTTRCRGRVQGARGWKGRRKTRRAWRAVLRACERSSHPPATHGSGWGGKTAQARLERTSSIIARWCAATLRRLSFSSSLRGRARGAGA